MSGERRKLQQVGGGTYTVSIPKEWATEQSLSAGETLRLYPDGDGALVVCRDGASTAPASATLSLEDDSAVPIDRTLRAAYGAGVERLTLRAANGLGEDRRHLDRAVREHTGTQIVAESDEEVVVRTILADDDVSLERTLVQLQFTTLSLFRTAVDRALNPSTTDDDRIDERRTEARRLSGLVTRQFTRSLSRPSTAVALSVDRATAFDCYRTARSLERLAAMAANLADIDECGPTADRLRPAADATRRYVERATTAVVERATLSEIRALEQRRSALASTIADATAAVDQPQPERCLYRLEECLAVGDRIATIALEATIRNDS